MRKDSLHRINGHIRPHRELLRVLLCGFRIAIRRMQQHQQHMRAQNVGGASGVSDDQRRMLDAFKVDSPAVFAVIAYVFGIGQRCAGLQRLQKQRRLTGVALQPLQQRPIAAQQPVPVVRAVDKPIRASDDFLHFPALVPTLQAEQDVGAHAERVRKRDDLRNVRHPGVGFPLGNGLKGDAEPFGQRLLRESALLPQSFDDLSHRLVHMECLPLSVSFLYFRLRQSRGREVTL